MDKMMDNFRAAILDTFGYGDKGSVPCLSNIYPTLSAKGGTYGR